MTRPCLCPDVAGQALELGRARDKRGQVEAEGLFDRAPLPFPGVALAIGAVAPDHQPGRHKLRQGSPQSRWRGPVRTYAQLAVGREHDGVLARRQCRIWMKRQQRVPSGLAPAPLANEGRSGYEPPLTKGLAKMRCLECGSEAVTERPERTAQGYRRFRCRTCGKQFNERSDTLLNRTQYPSDVIALV